MKDNYKVGDDYGGRLIRLYIDNSKLTLDLVDNFHVRG